jgi:enoyl-[acyl-carrier protein] reductase I
LPGVSPRHATTWARSRGVTGEVHHVDSGYHVVGMKRPDTPDISLSNSLSKE